MKLAFPGPGRDRSVWTLHALQAMKQGQGPKGDPGWGALSSRWWIRLKEVRGRGKEHGLHLHLKTGMNFNFYVKKKKGGRDRGKARESIQS